MRYRFEKLHQVFDTKEDDVIILPLAEVLKNGEPKKPYFVELPSLIYPSDEEKVKETLKELNTKDVVCENISEIEIANELGLNAHGGLFLNVMNSESLNVLKDLGLKDATLSMELNFSEVKKLKSDLPFGVVTYGYMPLMKFRTCPGDCNTCGGKSLVTDRLGEKFTLICRDKKYSELLNCVPTYVCDRSIPNCAFTEGYFTIETKEEAKRIRDLMLSGEPFPGKRTAGLYFRELL